VIGKILEFLAIKKLINWLRGKPNPPANSA
jgi:hypothetical protein